MLSNRVWATSFSQAQGLNLRRGLHKIRRPGAGLRTKAEKCEFNNAPKYIYKNTKYIQEHFYRAMLCIRGTSHGHVSVRPSVRHKSVFYRND